MDLAQITELIKQQLKEQGNEKIIILNINGTIKEDKPRKRGRPRKGDTEAERIENRQEYHSQYNKDRYNADEEFKARIKESNKKAYQKRKAAKQAQEQPREYTPEPAKEIITEETPELAETPEEPTTEAPQQEINQTHQQEPTTEVPQPEEHTKREPQTRQDNSINNTCQNEEDEEEGSEDNGPTQPAQQTNNINGSSASEKKKKKRQRYRQNKKNKLFNETK